MSIVTKKHRSYLRYPVKGRAPLIAELDCGGLMMQPESLKPILCVEQ